MKVKEMTSGFFFCFFQKVEESKPRENQNKYVSGKFASLMKNIVDTISQK